MPKEIHIRLAELSDFDSVFQLVNELEQFQFNQEEQEAIYNSSLRNPDIQYYVATIDNKVVGFISFHIQPLLHHGCRVGEIQELIVFEEYRNQKIGEKLIQTILDQCPKWKVYQIEVTSSYVREAAHRFYLRHGFKDFHKKFTLQIEGNPLI